MKNLLRAVSPLALIFALPITTHAQEAPPSRGVETVIVTAQKRDQAVLDVPVAITAYTGQRLEQLGIEQFDDLAAFTPGLEIQEQSPNNPGFVIRGLTSDDGGAASEPRVSVYQDGVSISRARGAYIELFDIERVEVAKGPQSTLFGRGALVGAVNVIQQKARLRNEGKARVTAGNFGQLTVDGAANVVLLNDTLGLRLAAISKQRDGYIDNIQGGGALMSQDLIGVRASAAIVPNDRLSFDIVLNYQKDTPTGTSFKSRSYAPVGGNTSPFTTAGLGTFSDAFGRQFEGGRELGIDRVVQGLTILTRFDISDSLTLNSISAAREFIASEVFDPDGFDQAVLLFAEDARGRQTSQEFRLNYDPETGPFSGFAGVSYFSENASQRVPLQFDQRGALILFSAVLANRPVDVLLPTPNFPNPANLTPALSAILPTVFGPALSPVLIAGANAKPTHLEEFSNFGETDALDFYADGTFKLLNNRLALTAGVRWTQEDKRAGVQARLLNGPAVIGSFPGRNGGLFIAPTPGGARLNRAEEFDAFTWRTVVNYELTQDWNLWASFAKGRRPDVIAPSVSPGAPNFTIVPAEIADSVEVGAKGMAFDGRLQVEASAFSYEYTNFQTSVRDSSGNLRTINAGGASSTGFEFQAIARPILPLTILATYGYNSGRFDDTDSAGQRQIFAGNQFRLSPDHTASLGLIYEQSLGDIGSMRLIGTYSWQSKVFFNDDNDKNDIDTLAESQDSYGLLGARARFSGPSKKWYIEGFVSNALDEEFLLDAGNTGGTFGIPTFIAGSPRMWGVTVGTTF